MAASGSSFRFSIGDFDCRVICDGKLTVPDIPPKPSPSLYHPIHPGNKMDLLCLIISSGGHTVLLDTGLGSEGLPDGGRLSANLRAAGIKRRDIDTVVISHGHGDHISGITDADGRLAFPGARYIMHRAEWEFWTSDPELSRLGFDEPARQMFSAGVRKNLLPIKDRLDLIDGEIKTVYGIKFITVPGHTPGHIVLDISSGGKQLLCLGDIMHEPAHLARPDLFDVFDIAPREAYESKIRLLSRVVTPGALVFGAHFPFPGLGHIVPEGKAWRWQPIKG